MVSVAFKERVEARQKSAAPWRSQGREIADADAEATATQVLPSGTVTFLFSDIEGSTKRWEAHGDAMRAAVESHDALLRAVFERHGGYVFKTIGDAFCVAFMLRPAHFWERSKPNARC